MKILLYALREPQLITMNVRTWDEPAASGARELRFAVRPFAHIAQRLVKQVRSLGVPDGAPSISFCLTGECGCKLSIS